MKAWMQGIKIHIDYNPKFTLKMNTRNIVIQKRIHFTLSNRCEEASKTNLLLFSTRFAHARYSSRVIHRFLN